MSLNEAFHDGPHHIPGNGQKILWRAKGTPDWREAIVDFTWMAEDEIAVSLVGGGNFFPAFGDEWKPSTAATL